MECTYSACVTLFASICSMDIVKPNDYSRRHKKNAMSRKSLLKYVAFHLQHVALRADLEVSILKNMSRVAPRTEGIISSASRFVRQEQHCFPSTFLQGAGNQTCGPSCLQLLQSIAGGQETHMDSSLGFSKKMRSVDVVHHPTTAAHFNLCTMYS